MFHRNLAQDSQMGSEPDIPPHFYALSGRSSPPLCVQWRAPQEDRAALSGARGHLAVADRPPVESHSLRRPARSVRRSVRTARADPGLRGVMDAWWFDQSQPRQEHGCLILLTHMNDRQDERVPLRVSGRLQRPTQTRDEIRTLRGTHQAHRSLVSFAISVASRQSWRRPSTCSGQQSKE